jgi:diguanylate cyclase (GGDEF)-like protein
MGTCLYHFEVASSCPIGLNSLCAPPLVETMHSILGLRDNKSTPSPLEGLPGFRSEQLESDQRQLARREWWLWFSALAVTALSATAFLLSSFPSFFLHNQHFYEIRSDQTRWAVMCLLLLFNGWFLYRQRSFRRERKLLMGENPGTQANAEVVSNPSGLDPVTGLYTRAFAEQQLGKEIARARRLNVALSLATIHLDDFAELHKQYGLSASDQALKEFARRLKKACRGSDFAVRLATDDFVLVLPECTLGEVKLVLNRLGSLEVNCSGRNIVLTYTTGWVDYQPGDLPADLLKRAAQLLRLYDNAAKDSSAATLAS